MKLSRNLNFVFILSVFIIALVGQAQAMAKEQPVLDTREINPAYWETSKDNNNLPKGIESVPEATNNWRSTFDADVFTSDALQLNNFILATLGWTAESDQAGASFGVSVSNAGDVNGDGYSDVIVGAYWYDNGQVDEGRAYVFHGSATGLSTTPTWTGEGDIPAEYGISVGTGGDVNGDGFDDVIVGAGSYNTVGRTFVYYGSALGLSSTPSWFAENGQTGSQFGASVSTAGDVNGDGFGDVIIGSFAYDNGSYNEGAAYVYLGSTSGLSTTYSWKVESDTDNGWLGRSVDTAGDVNGDGYDDVIVGAPSETSGNYGIGHAYVYLGSSSGLSLSPSWTKEIGQIGDWFGNSVSSAGDVNADGYADVIVGAPGYDNDQTNEGAAFVYYGSAVGVSGTPAWSVESNQTGAQYGFSVNNAGNVNGDSYVDIIVGSPYYDNGQTDEGRAFIYYGSSIGLATSSSWTAESDQASAKFGFSVNTAGDIYGYGYENIIVGAPNYDNGQTDEGRAFVYYENYAPFADAGSDQSVNTLSLVTLDGSGSSDPNGNALTYSWTQTSGSSVTLSDPTAVDPTFTAPGNPDSLTFSLIVTDTLGLPSEKDQVVITVNNQKPIANAGPNQTSNTLALVTLNGSGSSDPDGDLPLTYVWTQTSGPTISLSSHTISNPTFIAPSDPSTLTFSLTVTDSLSLVSLPDEVVVTVNNQKPVANAGVDQSVNTHSLVTLNGSLSTDPDGDLPLSYLWAQTGGPTVSLSSHTIVNPTFIAPADPSALTFSLTVTDSRGMASLPDDVVITTTQFYKYTYLPIISRPLPTPSSPTLNTITNSDQDNFFTVIWGSVNNASSYQLQEALDPLFSNTKVVYQGSGLSWTVPSPGKIPNPYYYRVKAINASGESEWSNAQQVTIFPLFIGLHLRWDGNGYIRGEEYYDIGYHESRDLDLLTSGYIIRSNNHDWYNPDPLGFGDSYWYSYYDVTKGIFLSSSAPGDPSWKWGYDWILPYALQLYDGQTVNIDNQAFIVSGPISGYTSWGKPIQYWQLVNRDQFLFWDGGGDWKQYVYSGEAVLRYDAGNTRLLIYDNVKRHDYYQGDPYNVTVQYIGNLTASNSFVGGLSVGNTLSESIPDVTTSVGSEKNNPLLPGHKK